MALGSDAGGLFGLAYVLSTAAAAAATAAGTQYYSPRIPMVRRQVTIPSNRPESMLVPS